MSGKGYINETVCNKNLFNVEKFMKFDNRNTFEVYSNIECLKIYGTEGRLDVVCEKNKQYTFQFKYIAKSGGTDIGSFQFLYNDGTKSLIRYSGEMDTSGTIYSATSTKNKTVIAILWHAWSYSSTVWIAKDSMQLEQGTTATDYIPHEEQTFQIPIQQPFRSIGNVRDRFVKIDGVWKEEHYIGKVVLDGTEDWVLQNVAVGQFSMFLKGVTSNVGFSDYFKTKTVYTIKEKPYLRLKSDGIFAEIGTEMLSDVSLTAWKTWLSQHPTTVDYQLVTPTYIDCTPEQTSILDKMYPFVGYNDITNFYSTDDLVPFAMANYQGTPSPQNSSDIYSTGDRKNLINLSDFNIAYTQEMEDVLETDFDLKPNFFYSFEFNYNINSATTDISYSLGYGVNGYIADIVPTTQYTIQTTGTNTASFQVPSDVPEGAKLYIKFAKTNILADINIDISNIQLEYGIVPTSYQSYDLFNIDLFSAGKNLYNYNKPMYIKATNATYSNINNGYNVTCMTMDDKAFIEIGYKNVLTANSEYAISYFTSGQFSNLELYTTFKDSQESLDKIEINNGVFTAPEGIYDLKLVIYVNSTAISNSLEIWNIQMEYGNTATEYEQYNSNNAILTLDAPLRGIGNVKDVICLKTINLINPNTIIANVEENEDYYFSNNTGNTITYTVEYRNADNNIISTESLTSGILHTPENCTTITFVNITSAQVISNKMQIEYGDSYTQYLPYIEQPCIIRNIGETEFIGTENWAYIAPQNFTLNNNEVSNCLNLPHSKVCNYFKYTSQDYSTALDNYLCENIQGQTAMFVFRPESNLVYDLTSWEQWLASKNSLNKPLRVDYQLRSPIVTFLTTEQVSIIKSLFTYNGITNVGTYNNSEADLTFDYVNDVTNQKTQNAYVLLKCFNNNLVPYIIHSNYIDIPTANSKVFIWTRRQGNLFDLQIENLGGEVERI